MRRPLMLLLTAAAVFALAGCSSSRPYDHKTVSPLPSSCSGGCKANATPTTSTATATVPAAYKNGDPAAGKIVFKTGPCASCHTLADAGTSGKVGPVLTGLKIPLSLVVDRVVNGKGVMPALKGTLSDKQIADVAAYVVKATGGNPNG